MQSVLITGAALTYSRPTASANRALNVAHGFGANGYSPTFFDLRGDGRVSTFEGFPVVQPFGGATAATLAHAVDALIAHAASHRYDVVFVLSSPIAVIQALSAACRNAILVYDLVEDPLGSLLNLPRRIYSLSFWRELASSCRDTWGWYRGGWIGPDVVTVISANLAAVASRVVPASSTVYLPILSSPQTLRTSVGASASINRHSIAYCGSISFAKDGISTLLDAMRVLRARRVPVRVDMFGHGLRSERARLEIMLKARRLADTVTWRGFVASEQLHAHLANSAALVLCKSNNRQNRFNFATRLIDYLAVGRPCIVSRVGEMASYFRHGRNALVFEPGDHEMLARHVEWVIDNPRQADEIGLSGQQLLSGPFDARQRIADLLAFLQERHRMGIAVDQSPVSRELVGSQEGAR